MRNFLFAVQFLTLLPVKIKRIDPGAESRSVVYFPLVGLMIGAIAAFVNWLSLWMGLGQFASSSVTVIALIILTGGMHLDGLSDAADGIASGKPRAEALEIMRDPRAGAIGVVAVISVILLKVAFLSSIDTAYKAISIILMCLLGRWSMVMSVAFFPYARQDGKAGSFFGQDGVRAVIAAVFTLGVSFLIAGPAGLVLFIFSTVFICLADLYFKKRIGGVTGDTIGAVSEITEVVTLLGVIVLQKVLF